MVWLKCKSREYIVGSKGLLNSLNSGSSRSSKLNLLGPRGSLAIAVGSAARLLIRQDIAPCLRPLQQLLHRRFALRTPVDYGDGDGGGQAAPVPESAAASEAGAETPTGRALGFNPEAFDVSSNAPAMEEQVEKMKELEKKVEDRDKKME